VATGGVSYPSTGSTGDGYAMAKTIGHTVTELKCGLCGVNTMGIPLENLQGLALKNVRLTAKYNQKTVFSDFGELLFTHFGLSGPIVLSASSKINRFPFENVTLELDLKPALDEQTLDKRILRDFEKYQNKQIVNALSELLPQKLISVVLKASGIPEKNVKNADKGKIKMVFTQLKDLFPLISLLTYSLSFKQYLSTFSFILSSTSLIFFIFPETKISIFASSFILKYCLTNSSLSILSISSIYPYLYIPRLSSLCVSSIALKIE
jgi:predicted Rossmann fold flavoprotein